MISESKVCFRKVDETKQHNQYIKWLNQAHNSIILLYTRDKVSRELARCMRPEFSKIYVASELKDALRLITKHNSDSDQRGIDLILADADHTTLRLMEAVQKRGINPLTSSLPIISIVLLIPENIDNEIKESVVSSGFASFIINSPYSVGNVFDTILETLHRRKIIEDAYTDLRKERALTKYPFNPVFDDVNKDNDVSNNEIIHNATSSNTPQINNNNTNNSNFANNIDIEIDDWTYSTQLLPKNIRAFREKALSQKSRESILSMVTSNTLNSNTVRKELKVEQKERRKIDRAILRSIEEKKDNIILSSDDEENDDDVKKENDFDDNDNDHDSISSAEDISTSIKKLNSGNNNNKIGKKDDFGSYNKNIFKSRSLLASSKSPRSHDNIYGNAVASPGDHTSRSHTLLMSDLRPFYDRSPPSISIPTTVAGMNKKAAEDCWAVLQGKNDFRRAVTVKSLSPVDRQHLKNSSGYSPFHQQLSKISRQSSGNTTQFQDHSTSATRLSVSAGGGGPTSSLLGSPIAAALAATAAIHTDILGSPIVVDPATTTTAAAAISFQLPSSSHHHNPPQSATDRFSPTISNMKKPHPLLLKSQSTMSDLNNIKSREKAIRVVKKMVKETPMDDFLYTLMELDVAQRKISAREWVYLEQGLRRQMNGDFDAAVQSYTRAVKRSKQPQLPMICRGVAYFKQGKYLFALKEFTAVIRYLKGVEDLQYDQHDDFIARYNRGITNFRLGNDSEGILDLKSSLELNEVDRKAVLQVRMILATALRRLGEYSEAIEETLVSRKMKSEDEEKLRKLSERRNSSIIGSNMNDSSPMLAAVMTPMLSFQTIEGGGGGGALEHSSNNNNIDSSNHNITRERDDQNPVEEEEGNDQFGSDLRSSSPGGGGGTTPPLAVTGGHIGLAGERTPNRAPSRKQLLKSDSVASLLSSNGDSTDGSTTKSARRGTGGAVGRPGVGNKSVRSGEESTQSRRIITNIEIKEKYAKNMSDRKQELLQKGTHKEGVSQSGGHLEAFKVMNGFKRNLFETHFVKPSLLQEALSCPGLKRTLAQLELIGAVLRGTFFFRSMSVPVIDELSSMVEYRPMPVKRLIFAQNKPVDCMYVILSGQVQLRLEKSHPSTSQSLVVCDLLPGEVFGHMDLLFRESNPFVHQFLKEDEEDDISMAWGGVGVGNGNQFSSSKVSLFNEDKSISNKNLPRALQGGAFMSYNIQAPTELIMINRREFSRLLAPAAIRSLEDRLMLLRACGLFSGYSRCELIRLARMGIVRKVKQGEVILQQGSAPQYLYIIISGLCRIVKRPTRSEMLVRRLSELREREKEYDCKYAFHHMLRHTLNKVSEGTLPPDRGSQYVTQSEAQRYALEIEINRLEAQLVKAKALDLKEEEEENRAKLMGGGSSSNNTSSERRQQCEIAVIKRPQLFGEAVLLEPATGKSLGTVLADTGCSLFCLHRGLLETIHISELTIERVRQRCVSYPPDDFLVQDAKFKKDWNEYKDSLMKSLNEGGVKHDTNVNESNYEVMEFSRY